MTGRHERKLRLASARFAAERKMFRARVETPVGYTREELHAFGGRLVIAAALWDANGHPARGTYDEPKPAPVGPLPIGPAEFTFDNFGRVDAIDADGNKWEFRDGAWKRDEPKT